MNNIYSKGLTLAELLLTMAITVFVLSGILNLYINCLFLNDANRSLTLATSHAQYVMENIRKSEFTALEDAIAIGNWDWDEADIRSNYLTPLRNESIDTNVFQGGNPLGVSVQVNWIEGAGRDRYKEFRTLLTKY